MKSRIPCWQILVSCHPWNSKRGHLSRNLLFLVRMHLDGIARNPAYLERGRRCERDMFLYFLHRLFAFLGLFAFFFQLPYLITNKRRCLEVEPVGGIVHLPSLLL